MIAVPTYAQSADVAIVGGGIIGLSLAWRLAAEGASVVVLERGQVGGQATGAAAGMLGPLAETSGPSRFVELGLASLRIYPEVVAALREETGMDAELHGPGMLRVAFDDVEAAALERAWCRQKDAGLPLEWLDGMEARRVEPALSPAVSAAVLSVAERHVEPRRLARAFALAAVRRGVAIGEGTPVTGFETRRSRVTALLAGGDRIACGALVLAGGAWVAESAAHLGSTLPVFPVRGQILALACTPPPIRHTIYARSGYLVPKADGRVVVGATEDDAGFDTRPTAAGMVTLLGMASTLVPSLASAPFESAWAGLRPASRDRMPLLGPLPGWENVTVAAGHFRNGILLAPITATCLAPWILYGRMDPLLEPFRPARFACDAR
jgi:glycine oxidase